MQKDQPSQSGGLVQGTLFFNRLGVKSVAQAVTNDVQAQHRHADQCAWDEQQMQPACEEGLGIRQHVSPAWSRFLHT